MKYLTSGVACAKSGIATTYKYKTNNEVKEEVCFIDIVMFGKMAEKLNQYVKKGSQVLIDGRLKFESWEAEDETKRSKHVIMVNEIKFLDDKKQSIKQDNQQQNNETPF